MLDPSPPSETPTTEESPRHTVAPREYPSRPLVGVGALIVEGDRILLIRRASAPSKGEWSIPGGLVRLGETLKEAVVREAREETGLTVDPGDLVEVVDRIFHDPEGRIQYHYVVADFLCTVTGGELRPGSDAGETLWVAREDLTSMRLAPITFRVALAALDLVQTKE